MSELENFVEHIGSDAKRPQPVSPLEKQLRSFEARQNHLEDPMSRHHTLLEARRASMLDPLEAQRDVALARREHLLAPVAGVGGRRSPPKETPVLEALDKSHEVRNGYSLKTATPLQSAVEANANMELSAMQIVGNKPILKRHKDLYIYRETPEDE